jgi:hypothetical protein
MLRQREQANVMAHGDYKEGLAQGKKVVDKPEAIALIGPK